MLLKKRRDVHREDWPQRRCRRARNAVVRATRQRRCQRQRERRHARVANQGRTGMAASGRPVSAAYESESSSPTYLGLCTP